MDSVDQTQLLGGISTSSIDECDPLTYNGSLVLHPCGLIANTLVNDIYTITSGQTMEETGIAWESDLDDKVCTCSFCEKIHAITCERCD